MNIDIFSEKKGSNPGGKCVVVDRKTRFNGYFKYCYGNKFNGATSFKANHQPIYEAITFSIVRELGLPTTDFYVVDNRARDVTFTDWRKFIDHDPSGRDFYFISKLLLLASNGDESIANTKLEKDSTYLNSVLVSDVIGKRQNYEVRLEGLEPKIIYLDLGCSFVYAKDGFISLPHQHKTFESKSFKTLSKRLNGTKIVGADNDRIVDLGEMVSRLPYMQLPTMNSNSKVTVGEVLSEEETKEIQYQFVNSLMASIPGFKEKGALL